MDNSGDSAGSLVTWNGGKCWWQLDSLATGYCSGCVGDQSVNRTSSSLVQTHKARHFGAALGLAESEKG